MPTLLNSNLFIYTSFQDYNSFDTSFIGGICDICGFILARIGSNLAQKCAEVAQKCANLAQKCARRARRGTRKHLQILIFSPEIQKKEKFMYPRTTNEPLRTFFML